MKKFKKEWWVYTEKGVLVGHGYEYGKYLYDSHIKNTIFERYGYSEEKGYKIVVK